MSIVFSDRKSSTVPDSVAMTMLARKRPSPVIQVTVKQTETNPGLIGVVRDTYCTQEETACWLCVSLENLILIMCFFFVLFTQECSKSDEGETLEGDLVAVKREFFSFWPLTFDL